MARPAIPQMLVAAGRAYSEHAFASREGGGTCVYADYAFGLSLQAEALRREVCGRYVNRTRVPTLCGRMVRVMPSAQSHDTLKLLGRHASSDRVAANARHLYLPQASVTLSH